MKTVIPRLNRFVVDSAIEDHLPQYSSSPTPDRSEDVIMLMLRRERRSVTDRRRIRVTRNHPNFEQAFILSEDQARELADSLLLEANNLAKRGNEEAQQKTP